MFALCRKEIAIDFIRSICSYTFANRRFYHWMEGNMQNFHHVNVCPIRDIISRISSKWTMLVLVTLHSNGTMRFNDIQKSIGEVSQRMLTVTLRSLEADGLIHRKVYPEVPPKVEYKLSERGESLMPLLQSLIDWALEHAEAIMEDRNKDR